MMGDDMATYSTGRGPRCAPPLPHMGNPDPACTLSGKWKIEGRLIANGWVELQSHLDEGFCPHLLEPVLEEPLGFLFEVLISHLLLHLFVGAYAGAGQVRSLRSCHALHYIYKQTEM